MGRRQVKLRRSDLNAITLNSYTGQLVDVVCTDQSTVHGRLVEVRSSGIMLEAVNAQWYNRSSHRQDIDFSHVQYIYINILSAY